MFFKHNDCADCITQYPILDFSFLFCSIASERNHTHKQHCLNPIPSTHCIGKRNVQLNHSYSIVTLSSIHIQNLFDREVRKKEGRSIADYIQGHTEHVKFTIASASRPFYLGLPLVGNVQCFSNPQPSHKSR